MQETLDTKWNVVVNIKYFEAWEILAAGMKCKPSAKTFIFRLKYAFPQLII